jgi:crossover junction endodeoxyribonuclease RuvC
LLGQARGAAICGLMTAGIDVAEYTALQTKQATVGHGRATKAQVQQMVTRLLRLSGVPTTDAADALACAICHAHVGASVAVLRGAAPDLAIAGLSIRRGRVAARG